MTLTGPGGAGKTLLAIEAARTRGRAHGDVCCAELAQLADGAGIPYAIFGALGVREGFRARGGAATARLLGDAGLADAQLPFLAGVLKRLTEKAASDLVPKDCEVLADG